MDLAGIARLPQVRTLAAAATSARLKHLCGREGQMRNPVILFPNRDNYRFGDKRNPYERSTLATISVR